MSDNRCNHVTRVLFCGPHFPDSHNYTREYLQGYPFVQVDDVPLESVPAVIGDYDICVVKSFRMNSDVLSRAKRMKLIMQFGVGLEGQIDFVFSFSTCLRPLVFLFSFILILFLW